MPTIRQFTQSILNIFCQLTTIPHGSHNTSEMAAFLESFATKYNYKVKTDTLGNILVSKENANPKVCFQSHYDMVCVGIAAQNLALKLVQTKRKKNNREQTWLKAQDSSLGADNGIGMAIMMFFMQQGVDAEFLFTNDEEVGMIGAKGLEIPINSKILINLDSEVLGEITISCAGGFDLNCQSEFITTQIPPNHHYYILQSRNFAGGHSGLDINNPAPNYQNAILESIYFLKNKLKQYENKVSLYIINWKGGEKRNSIPMNSKLIVASEQKLDIETNDFFVFEELKEQQNELLDKTNEIFLQTPSGIEFDILHDYLLSLKIGVLDMNGKLVQNSRSLSHISFANGNLELAFMGRANTKKFLESNLTHLKALLSKPQTNQNKESIQIKMSEYYAPWEKQDKSINSAICSQKMQISTTINKPYTLKEVVQSMCASMRKYTQPLNITPKIVELHAGLECGILLQRFEEMGLSDIIALSIGPSINAPHSINEEVWIESAGVIVAILQDFMEKL